MPVKIGSNSNTNDGKDITGAFVKVMPADITLVANISTKVFDEETPTTRVIHKSIVNLGPDDIRIKTQPASLDNDIKGELLGCGKVYIFTLGDMYLGEISVISEGTPTVAIGIY